MTYPEILALARKCGFVNFAGFSFTAPDEAALRSFAAAIAEHCARVADARDTDIASEIRSAFPAPETKP